MSERDPRALAREIAGLARAHAGATETLGRVADPVLAAMQQAGLPQLLKPGERRNFREFIDVCGILAEGCMSAGWCNFVWGMHNYVIALYPRAVQAEVWAEPTTLVSASLGPVGTCEGISHDGAVVTGHWRFNSGCDHADWLLLGFTPPDGEPHLGLFNKDEFEIDHDSWDVIGLRGTGSKDARANEVALPPERMLPFSESIVPYGALLMLVIVGPVIGGAQGAVDEFARIMKEKTMSVTGKRMSENTTSLLRLSESSAEVDAARALVMARADELDANPTPGVLETTRIFRDTGYAAKLCNQATRRLFEAAGGAALQSSGEMQRIFRNVAAGCNHARLVWDEQALPYGRVVVGD